MRRLAKIEMPECPRCGSSVFYIEGTVAYRRPYDAASNSFGTYGLKPSQHDASSGRCAECGRDVTELLAAFRILEPHGAPSKVPRHSASRI